MCLAILLGSAGAAPQTPPAKSPVNEMGGTLLFSRRHRYNALVITRGIREFVSRDWRAARESKDAYWGERIARLGPIEGFRIAEELRRQAVLTDATWPDASLRRQDVLFHAHLADLFRRAAPTRRP